MPDVALVLHEPEPGGATTAVLRLLPAMRRRGWEFAAWAPGPGGTWDALRGSGVDVDVDGLPRLLRYHWDTLRDPPGALRRLGSVPGYLRATRAWLKQHQSTLIHVNTLTSVPEALVARSTGRPVVLHAHEMIGEGFAGAAVARGARLAAREVVAVSHACSAALYKHGVDSVVIRNGVAFPATPAPLSPARAARP